MSDQGYFGADSVSWRVFAHPVSKLGGYCAMMLQGLNPAMIKLFTSVTISREEGSVFSDSRAEHTGRYFETITFGDKEHADKAAETVRRMHAHARWTDPDTGEELRADNPHYLAWTHNTFIWSLIRVMQEFGGGLSDEDAQRFIEEQFKAAEFQGLDPNDRELVPGTWEDLDAYIEAQKSWVALGVGMSEVSIDLRSPQHLTFQEKFMRNFSLSIFAIMPEYAAHLYGYRRDSKEIVKAANFTRSVMKSVAKKTEEGKMVNDALDRVQSEPFRKTRSDRAAAHRKEGDADGEAPKGGCPVAH